jgi:hypothetical protein
MRGQADLDRMEFHFLKCRFHEPLLRFGAGLLSDDQRKLWGLGLWGGSLRPCACKCQQRLLPVVRRFAALGLESLQPCLHGVCLNRVGHDESFEVIRLQSLTWSAGGASRLSLFDY